jgi:hypothetical protein
MVRREALQIVHLAQYDGIAARRRCGLDLLHVVKLQTRIKQGVTWSRGCI